MNDLSVLVPPFLMCAAVIFAIVAFLRHEMGRARPGRREADDDNSASLPTSADKLDDGEGNAPDASSTSQRDG